MIGQTNKRTVKQRFQLYKQRYILYKETFANKLSVKIKGLVFSFYVLITISTDSFCLLLLQIYHSFVVSSHLPLVLFSMVHPVFYDVSSCWFLLFTLLVFINHPAVPFVFFLKKSQKNLIQKLNFNFMEFQLYRTSNQCLDLKQLITKPRIRKSESP